MAKTAVYIHRENRRTHKQAQKVQSFIKKFKSFAGDKIQRFDAAGSAAAGDFGFGHDNYSDEISAGRFGNDAFANMYVAVTHGYQEFQTVYPDLWSFIEGYVKR